MKPLKDVGMVAPGDFLEVSGTTVRACSVMTVIEYFTMLIGSVHDHPDIWQQFNNIIENRQIFSDY